MAVDRICVLTWSMKYIGPFITGRHNFPFFISVQFFRDRPFPAEELSPTLGTSQQLPQTFQVVVLAHDKHAHCMFVHATPCSCALNIILKLTRAARHYEEVIRWLFLSLPHFKLIATCILQLKWKEQKYLTIYIYDFVKTTVDLSPQFALQDSGRIGYDQEEGTIKTSWRWHTSLCAIARSAFVLLVWEETASHLTGQIFAFSAFLQLVRVVW